jgi:hypothetical protein
MPIAVQGDGSNGGSLKTKGSLDGSCTDARSSPESGMKWSGVGMSDRISSIVWPYRGHRK